MEDSIKIRSKEEFLTFLEALVKDFNDSKSNWPNRSLESYLGAMASWVDDMEGYYENMGILKEVNFEEVNWQVFSDILLAARVYE
jgi:hypothetical protein